MKRNNSDTTDTYLSEGAMYGAVAGAVIFVISLCLHQSAYGAVLLLICVVAGVLIGMRIKKPKPDTEKEKEVEAYKKLDIEYNAFFPDRKSYSYDPKRKHPVLRTSIANGEQVAGFIDLRTSKFEPVMLIKNDDDLKDFIYRYGIKNPSDIQRVG